MDLLIWFMAAVLLAAVQADPADKGPQIFEKTSSSSTPAPSPSPTPTSQKHSKRQPKVGYREVIMYLTPTQIRALEAGQGIIESQPTAQPVLSIQNHEQKEETQRTLLDESQQLQREYEKMEANRKQRIQLQEAIQTQHTNELLEQAAVNEANNRPQVEENHRENYPEFIPQPQLIQRPPPRLEDIALSQGKRQWRPNNYAYLYFFPKGKLQSNKNLQLFYPEPPENRPNDQLILQEQPHDNLPPKLNPLLKEKFILMPYEYGSDLRLEAQRLKGHEREAQQLVAVAEQLETQLLQAQHEKVKLEAHQHESHRAVAQQLEDQLQAQQKANLEAHQLSAQQQAAHNLQAQHKAHLEAHQLSAQQQAAQHLEDNLQAQQKANLEAHQLSTQQHAAQHLEDNLQAQHKAHLEAQQLSAQQHIAQQIEDHLEAQHNANLEAHQLTAHQHVAQQLEDNLEALHKANFEAHQLADQQHTAHQLEANLEAHHAAQQQAAHQFKVSLEAHHLAAKQQTAQQLEAQKLDDHLESQQKEAELHNAQQHQLQQFDAQQQLLHAVESNKNPFDSLLSPLIQHQNILQSFSRQENKFELNPPQFEGGFVPLQYAPKYNNEKYTKEIEKVLVLNHLENQKALEKAEAIAKAPPVVVRDEITVTKRRPIEIIKHVKVPYPAPFYVPVPEPFEVKVPQPYPVPLEIIRHVPYPIIKTEKIEVEKPVPIEIEKHVPVPVTKNVYVNVERPYLVRRVVPVEVKKEIPVEIPILKPQKLTILRHVWEH